MSPAQYALIKSVVLPPGIFLAAFILCLFVYLINKRVSFYVLIISIFFLYLFSTPIFSRYLASMIENYNVINIEQLDKSKSLAIVVLGCGRNPEAPEFSGNDVVSSCTLVRLRYAALLQKATELSIVVSGGSVFDESISEAALMRDVLENEFNAKVLLIEDKSRNTIQNAKEVALLLEKNNIYQILLVTHAIHMLRAEYSFDKYGVDVIPAPTYFYSTKDNKPFYFDFLPTIKALYVSNITLYEMIGYLWIQL